MIGVPRGRRLIPAINALLEQAAARRERLVASVTAAVEPVRSAAGAPRRHPQGRLRPRHPDQRRRGP
ncbi:hypothetical protein [Demequina litorisediminis]|uniref:hypothetical protein n=1 Tax=Demequina litorisediminis TaxID=1849022 RepID=UPI0024E0ED17|nr:hypothetical protein [Demequina litorisediminis]